MSAEIGPTAVDRVGRTSRLRRAWLWHLLVLTGLAAATVRRSLDLLLALAVSLATAPVALAAVFTARSRGAPPVRYGVYAGRLLRPIRLGALAAPGPLSRLPWVWAILRGDLAWVGPEPLAIGEAERLPPARLGRFQVRPGLVDLFRVRSAVNVAFEGRAASEDELVHAAGIGRELGILARSIPAAMLGGGVPAGPPQESLDLLGVRIDNWTMERAVGWLRSAAAGDRPHTVVFVNPHCLNVAAVDPGYRAVLARSDIVLPDGIGIHFACRLKGTTLAANVNGTDLFPRLCTAMEGSGHGVFLIGGRPGVAEELERRMAERWPGLEVAGLQHGYFARGGDEERGVVERIRDSGASVLLVAFGVPAQELWIDRWRQDLGVAVAIGVGGLFDFYSGRIPRAPGWVREVGLEWAWRLAREPRRMWRRYVIGNPLFLWRVWRWRRECPEAAGGDV